MSFLFVGLGNPDHQYLKTRHNAGFQVIDLLAHRLEVSCRKKLFKPIIMGRGTYQSINYFLIKPLTYMNRSGSVLPKLLKKHDLSLNSLVVIVDNLDLATGTCRIKKGGGDAGHNGIASVVKALNFTDFIRIYVGIGRPAQKQDVVHYVLGIPDEHEINLYKQGIEKATICAENLLKYPLDQVMNEFNRKKTHK